MGKKLFIICTLILAAMFLPTTLLLAFGMLPTLAAFTVDRTIGKSKTICVGFMNFAGCFPFLLDFWMTFGEQNLENALTIIADVETVIIIYLLAAGGYAIDIAITGITTSIITQTSTNRVKKINETQKKLQKDWGDKVTGKYKLDEYGFPIETMDQQRTRL